MVAAVVVKVLICTLQVVWPYLFLKLEECYKRAEEEEGPEGRSGLFQKLYPVGHFLWEVYMH